MCLFSIRPILYTKVTPVLTPSLPMKNDLTDKMLRLRNLFGYSQDYLAVQMDITQSAYSQLENGKIELSLKLLKKLVGVYRIEQGDFLAKCPTQLTEQVMLSPLFRQKWGRI